MKNTYLFTVCCIALLLTVCNANAQDDANVKAIAEKACDCTRQISVEQAKDSITAKINSCITASIMDDQMMATVTNMSNDVKGAIANGVTKDTTLTALDGKTYTINVAKDFDAIQAYMFDNCPRLKMLISTNNGQLDYSMSKNKKALKLYEEATNYEAREMYDMAIVSYTKALKIDSKFSFAWDNLGLCYRKMGNYKEAIKSYQKSLDLDPKGTTPLQNIAVAYEYLKDYKNASATYNKFMTLHPDNPEGYFGAGRTYYLLDDYAKGVDYMFKAYLLYTESKSPYVNDAKQNLQYYYSDLEKKGKTEVFNQAAKNNNIELK